MVKSIWSPYHNRPVKLGRRRSKPEAVAAHPRFRDYARVAGLGAPPATADFSGPAMAALQNIYGNDQEGDCVEAAGWHCLGVYTGNAGNLIVGTLDQVNSDYNGIAGYVPGNPSTDNGSDPATANDYWINHGFADTGIKLVSAPAVDATDKAELQRAIVASRGCVVLAMDLPEEWIGPAPSAPGFVWDVAGPPDPANGHEVMLYGYGANGAFVDTWAMVPGSVITYEAIAYYAAPAQGGECYALMFPQAPGPNPNPPPGPGPSPPPPGADVATLMNFLYAQCGAMRNTYDALESWLREHVPNITGQ